MDAAPRKLADNPLILAAVGASLVAVGAVYQLFVQPQLNPLHIVRLVVLVIFLALYIAKSRFAWYVIAFAVLVITPAYVVVPQMQSHSVQPITGPVLIFLSLVCLVYLWRVRRPYFRFVQGAATSDI